MKKERLLAFSDGVIAIIITIMVLELKVPHSAEWAALTKLVPVFLSYVLSFIYIAIYWNNHHHLMHTFTRINGLILWANTHLLFWLSLIPFATGWMGENHFVPLPTAVYGAALLMPALAYYLLQLRSCGRRELIHPWRRRSATMSKARYRPCSISRRSHWRLSVRGSRVASTCWSP